MDPQGTTEICGKVDHFISGPHLSVRCHRLTDDRQFCAQEINLLTSREQGQGSHRRYSTRSLGGGYDIYFYVVLLSSPSPGKPNNPIEPYVELPILLIHVTQRHPGKSHIAALVMMVVGLGTALWGASSFSRASAFAPPLFLSSAASNAFVSRRTSLASSALEQQAISLDQAAAAAGASTTTTRRRRQQQRHGSGGSSGGGGGGGMVMLFDFIKKRAQEGVEQTQNLVTAAQTGRLDEALKETSAYVKDR